MRTGRPRKKDADRYPCGKAKPRTADQIAEAQRLAAEAQMATVLAQPHRRGNRSQLAESPLGRFCLEHGLPREVFDAGESYASLKRRYQSAVGAPMPDRLGGSGSDIEWLAVARWRSRLEALEGAMLNAGGPVGLKCATTLLLDRPSIPIEGSVKKTARSLLALAVAKGLLEKKPT